MKYNNEYPLSQWIIDSRDIIAQREAMPKKEALLLIVEEIESWLEDYEYGSKPIAAYERLFGDNK
jgi:hypothetical protein